MTHDVRFGAQLWSQASDWPEYLGAAIAAEPMPKTRCRYSVVKPIERADAVTPTSRPSCW
mgnify:CR=1 FL=1